MEVNHMAKYLRMAGVIFLALTIILSCTVVGNKLTDPATYAHTIEVLDHNRSTILGLTAASAAASAAVSALPDDICSPLAQEISDFTTYFMLILSVIYLEKYLLTILAAAACYILIPVGCSSLLVNCFFPSGMLKNIGAKLVVFGAAVLLVIPTSVWVSDQINAIYSESIEITVESASAVSENLIGEAADDGEENTTVIDEAKALLGDLSGSVAGVVEQFKNLLNRFIEATAVMIVTTCLIPLLVIVFFVWIVKTLFNVQIILPTSIPKPKRHKRLHGDENELALTE
jgi:hypothetical protein